MFFVLAVIKDSLALEIITKSISVTVPSKFKE